MARQAPLFPMPAPRLNPDTRYRLQRLLEDTDPALATCKLSIAVAYEPDNGKPEKYTATFEVLGEFLTALLAPPDLDITVRRAAPSPEPEELPVVPAGEPTPLERLAQLAERKADAGDGSLTLLKSVTGWRVLLGAPDDDTPFDAMVADLTEHPTLKDALLGLLNA